MAVLENHPKIIELFRDEEKMKRLLDIRMEEEQGRLDGIPNVAPKDFIFFEKVKDSNAISKAYDTMQNQYVLRDEDRIDFENATAALERIKEHLVQTRAWSMYEVSKDQKKRDDKDVR